MEKIKMAGEMLLEVTGSLEKGVQLTMTPEAFAVFMGYANLRELLRDHETFDKALEHWRTRWVKMGLEVVAG